MANIFNTLNTVRDNLIDEIIDAERLLKGTGVDEASLRDELRKLDLFALAQTSTCAQAAVQLRQQNELTIETRRLIEAQRRSELNKTKSYLS